jgi:acyl dehydratase
MSERQSSEALGLEAPPITRTTLALFAGGSGDHNPMHIDIDFAKRAGLDDVFAHGMLSMAYLGRLLTNNFQPRAIRRFKVRFTAITNVGEAISCTASQAAPSEDGVLRLALEAKAGGSKITLVGQADVEA